MNATLGLQSTALMAKAYGLVPKKYPPKKKPKLIKGFVDITVGTALLKPTANIVKDL